jgi:Zn-dependent peptidase ImmA (M78 family)
MNKKIETHVESILSQFKITKLPVPVEKIALKLDLAVTPADLGPGISGALFVNNGKASIGVNEKESKVRRRFTIAHELGHYLLHKNSQTLFVEKKVFFRDEESSSGEERKEREANAFAAALLMPYSILKSEIDVAKQSIILESDEDLVSYLSKKFDVSEIAMTYRLMNLNYIH